MGTDGSMPGRFRERKQVGAITVRDSGLHVFVPLALLLETWVLTLEMTSNDSLVYLHLCSFTPPTLHIPTNTTLLQFFNARVP